MKLIEVLCACALLALCGTSFFFVAQSCVCVGSKTAQMQEELMHDSFVVGGIKRAVINGTVSEFLTTCQRLWPNESICFSVDSSSYGKTLYVCEWTYLGKRKGMRINKGGESE